MWTEPLLRLSTASSLGSARCVMKVLKLTSIAIALAALPMLGSCADQQESIIIAGAPAWAPGECSVQVPAMFYLDRGRLDVRFGTQYLVPLEIQNQLTVQSTDSTNSGTDNSELQITGVDVRLSSAQRPDLIDRLEDEAGEAFIDFTPAVPTNSLTGSSSLGFLVTGIPAATSAKLAEYRVEEALEAGEAAEMELEGTGATETEILAARLSAENGVLQAVETIVVSMVVRARRSGNSTGSGVGEIESRQFDFPVDVCHGCLTQCSSCSFEVDLDADGEPETITGECPDPTVRSTPTGRLFIGDYVGTNATCPSAQDSYFVPAVCAN